MKHWYVTGPKQLSIVDEPIPAPGPGEVLIRTAFTALSPGSNVHVYRTGTYAATWTPGNVEALYMGSGVIEAAGAGVDPARVGERVAFNGLGHQEFGVIASVRAHRIPDAVPLDVASLAYLSAWSVSALHLGRYAAAETVAVVGQGLVGASAAITADAMGARVLGIDADPHRVAFAKRLGLGCVENATDLPESDRALVFLGEAGPDLIIETTGNWSGFRTALSLARDYTRIALMGIYREPPPPDLTEVLHRELFGFPSTFHYKRIEIIGCGSDPDAISEPMPRMATKRRNFAWVLERAGRGRLALDALMTSRVPADQLEPMLLGFLNGDRSQVGVVFDWGVESTGEVSA